MIGDDDMNTFINKKMMFLTILISISFAALQTAFHLPLHTFILYSFFVLFSVIYDRNHKSKRKGIFPIFYISMIVLGIIGLTYFLEGGRIAYNLLVTCYEQNSNYTFNLIEIAVPQEEYSIYLTITCMYIFAWLYSLSYECLRKFHNIAAFLVSFVLFFPILLYSTPQPWLCTLPLLACWLTLLWNSFSNKMKISNQNIVLKPFLISLTLIIACFFIMPESSFSNRAATQKIRDMILNKIDMFVYNITHSGEKDGEVDLGRAGNRFYSGATQLKVTSEKTHKRMYLKSYSGALYENNHWVSLPDADYASLHDTKQKDSFTWFDKEVYDSGILSESEKIDLMKKLYTIDIEDHRASKTYAIYPYMMQSSKTELKNHYDAYMKSDTNTYEYKLWNEETIGVNYTVPNQNDYSSFVQNHYLQIPQETENMLSSVKLEFDRNTEDVTTSYLIGKIRDYLAVNTKYTLSPGRTPDGKDFVDYFLHENKQGYCVHYATAATLLLRYYGIPARYAEGFVVEPSNYNGDIASVPDRNAHAWVEIFDNEKGWIPIEVTPTFTESKNDGTQTNKPKENSENENANQQTPANTQNQNKDTTKTTNTEQDANNTNGLDMSLLKYLLISAGIIISLLAILLQRNVRLSRRKKACTQKDDRKAILESYGYMHKCEVDMEIDETIQALVDKAQFSNHDITAAQSMQVYKYATYKVKQHYQTLPFLKKLCFRFWKALW